MLLPWSAYLLRRAELLVPILSLTPHRGALINAAVSSFRIPVRKYIISHH